MSLVDLTQNSPISNPNERVSSIKNEEIILLSGDTNISPSPPCEPLPLTSPSFNLSSESLNNSIESIFITNVVHYEGSFSPLPSVNLKFTSLSSSDEERELESDRITSKSEDREEQTEMDPQQMDREEVDLILGTSLLGDDEHPLDYGLTQEEDFWDSNTRVFHYEGSEYEGESRFNGIEPTIIMPPISSSSSDIISLLDSPQPEIKKKSFSLESFSIFAQNDINLMAFNLENVQVSNKSTEIIQPKKKSKCLNDSSQVPKKKSRIRNETTVTEENHDSFPDHYISDHEFILPCKELTYTLTILLDIREKESSLILRYLQEHSIPCRTAQLALGDFLWVAWPNVKITKILNLYFNTYLLSYSLGSKFI